MVAGPVVSVGSAGPPVGGIGIGMSDGGVRFEGDGGCELGSGMAGNGGAGVWVLIAFLASTRAITNATTSNSAAAATIHSHRGGFGPPGGGGGCGGWPGGGASFCPDARS